MGPTAAIEVDARGLRCPLPVIRLAEAARTVPAGSRVTVLATDPAARHDIAAWCRMRGHELVEMTHVPDPADPTDPAYLRLVVLVLPQPPNPAGAGSDNALPSRAT